MKVESIALYKPVDGSMTTSFRVGSKIVKDGTETVDSVKKITVSMFGTVKIYISNGELYVFKGLPCSYVLI